MDKILSIILIPVIALFSGIYSSGKIRIENLIQPSPTMVLLPTRPPTPTPTSSLIPAKKAINTDPVVSCESSASECNGKSIEVRKSQCQNITCCQVGSTYSVYSSVGKCKEAQNGKQSTQNQNSNVNCWQKRNDGSFVYNFGAIPRSECDSQVKALSDSLSHFRDPVTGTTLVDCKFKSSDYSFDFGRITSDQCKEKSNAFWKEKNDTIKNRPTIGTQNSPPTSLPPQKTKAQCQAEVRAKYDALQSQYGGGSALESINQNYNAEMNSCNQYS